jgi:oligopeptidase A
LIAAGRATIERLAADPAPPTWENFIEPLDDVNERLARAWSQVGHLNAVVNTPALRDAYNGALPKVTQYFTEQGQDQRLHARFKALKASPAYAALTAARKRLVERRAARLPPGRRRAPARAEETLHGRWQEELAKLSSRFQDNVLDATNDFALYVADEARLSGIPADVLATAKQAARRTASRAGSSPCTCLRTCR